MNHAFEDVKEFHEAFGVPIACEPVLLTPERAKKRASWITEEVQEFLVATDKADIVEQADAMLDILYFTLGTFVEMGISPEELFTIVHQANMSKLFPDGKAHYNIDGKIQKPEGWENPYAKLSRAINDMKNK